MDQRTHGTGADGLPLAQLSAWNLNEDTQWHDFWRDAVIEAKYIDNGKEYTTSDSSDQEWHDFWRDAVIEAKYIDNGKEYTTSDSSDQELPDSSLDAFFPVEYIENGKEYTTPDLAEQESPDFPLNSFLLPQRRFRRGNKYWSRDPADKGDIYPNADALMNTVRIYEKNREELNALPPHQQGPPQIRHRRKRYMPSSYQKETRQDHAYMQSPMVQSVLNTGVDRDRVRNVIERRLRDTGNTYPNTEALMDAVLNYEQNRGELDASPSHHQGPPQIRQTDEHCNARRRSRSSTSSQQEENHQVHAQMQSPMVQKCLNTGFDRDRVRKVIERRLRETGNAFPNADALMNAVLNSGQTREVLKKAYSRDQDSPVVPQSQSPSTESRNSSSQNPDLEQEVRELRQKTQCKVCLESEVGVVFLPCGHLCCCNSCAPRVQKCPVCRSPIQNRVRSYIS